MNKKLQTHLRILLLIPLLVLQVSGVLAQQLGIKGKVTDETGVGLPGVAVVLKGTTTGTSTDANGDYSISVPASGGILVFSYISYQTQEVPVTNQTTLNVTLKTDTKALDEVVVIGYGTQRRADVTSSVATVKSDDFVKAPVVDAGQLLQGKVAGLTVVSSNGDPASGTAILLRGNTTLFGANSDPLVLIDGIPGNLKTVAPEDIASVDVLKDGSAAAIYGTRGTNGVIIITTKRASGDFDSSIEYSGSVSTQTIAKKLDMLTADDYRAQIAAGTRPSNMDLGGNTNWLDEITQTPISNVHNLTFRGGNRKTNYLANANYRALNGVFKKSDNKTFTGRVDINHNMLDDKLHLNLGFLNTHNKFTTTGDGFSFNGYTYRQSLIFNPTTPIRNAEGQYYEQPGNFNYENPLGRLFESDGENTSQNNRLSAVLTYNPIQSLTLKALGSYTRFNEERGYAETKNHISTVRDGRNGFASVGSSQNIDRLLELTSEYATTLGSHRVSILGGYTYQEMDTRNQWMQNWNFPTDMFGYSSIGLGTARALGITPIYSGRFKTNLISFIGRVSYSFKDKYLLLANLRHEAASTLAGTNKPWGTFPAISAGWRITNEPFMESQNLFDELKLRAGYGVTGSNPRDLFLGQATLSYGDSYYSNGQWIQTLGPARNPNPYLRWEEKHESNFGLDYSMLGGRISGTFDYYYRRISGLLYDFPVPSPPNLVGFTRANVGKMDNKGFEALVNLVPVQKADFNWTTTLLFSTNENKLVNFQNELYKTSSNYITAGGTGEPIQTFTHLINAGDNIGDFYGFKVIDVSESGEWIYEDKDGNAVPYDDFSHSFEDKKVLGNGIPKYHAGWNNNFRYKNFDLGITMRGSFGFQILNFQRMYYENPSIQAYNRLKSAYEPVFGKAVLSNDMPLEFNSYYVEDGDFWKVDNITLGYTFKNLNAKYLQSARIYVSSLNTFVITNYKGIDPEVSWLGLSPGIDNRDKYPTTRTFTVGVNISL
ncbi:SusC/RagA family TonB-linked outer membrane protein [Rufibacter sediminis]|uniref:TonB-dependent receptor n=1 Tax=Rufibacter sediminis TaxID=2762756 RepID=A0ABR6VPU9_9BACT|nr:TonB-dependent receptor [Rufibacter sediminis]MBC3539219.1 TonB-dependent receptor [Rufibacter sediminis]